MAPLAPVKRRISLAAAAAATLVIGLLLKPAAPAAPPPAEAPAPMLQRVVEQRESTTIFRRMQAAWPQVARFTARIVAVPPPDGFEIGPVDPVYTSVRFGVVVGSRAILADVADLEEGATVRVTLGDGRGFEAQVTMRLPDRSLALIEAPDTVTLEAPARAAPVRGATALFAAAPRAEGNVIAPLFVAYTSSRELFTTNALDAFRGMPVFEVEGSLAGILAYEEGRVRLLTLDAALEPPPAAPPAAEPAPSES